MDGCGTGRSKAWSSVVEVSLEKLSRRPRKLRPDPSVFPPFGTAFRLFQGA